MEDDVADLSAGAAAGDGQSKSWRKLGTQRRKEKSIKKTVRRRLLYFSAPNGEFKGEFVLDAASVRVDDEIDRPHAFSLVTDKRVLYLQASSEDEREKWCIALDRNYRQKLLRSKFADSVKLLASGQWWNRLDRNGQETKGGERGEDDDSAASMSTRLQRKSSARDGATAGYTNTALYATLTSDRSSLAFFEDPDELPVVIVAFTQILDATLTTMTTSTQPLLTLTFHTDTGTSSWMLTMKTNKARSHESIESVVRHWHIALLDVKNMIEHETDGGRRSAEFDSNAPLSLHLQKKSMSPDSATTSEEQHNGQVLTKSARGRGAKAAQLDHVGPLPQPCTLPIIQCLQIRGSGRGREPGYRHPTPASGSRFF
jgi:hypothetical protein